jgi:hypothetical protein
MRQVRYSSSPPRGLNWSGGLRTLLFISAIGVALWWLATGPALDWLTSLVGWLRTL